LRSGMTVKRSGSLPCHETPSFLQCVVCDGMYEDGRAIRAVLGCAMLVWSGRASPQCMLAADPPIGRRSRSAAGTGCSGSMPTL
jgi:hypothetical protein